MALQTLLTPILYPTMNLANVYTMTYWTLDDDADKVAAIFDCPATGTLTQVAFGLSAVTTGDDAFSCRLETVSATDGKPTGTLIDSPANAAYGAVDIDDADDNNIIICNINGGTGVSVVKNECAGGAGPMALVMSPSTDNANFRLSYNSTPVASERPYGADDLAAGAWTIREYTVPAAVKIGGVWYPTPGSMIFGATANEVIDNNGTPEQRGMIFYATFKGRVAGVRCPSYIVAGSSFYVKMYSDPLGTPSEVATTPLIDSDQIANDAAARQITLLFTSPYAYTVNTKYAIVISPGDAGDINYAYMNCGINTLKTAYPGGEYCVHCYRNDTNAFSEDDTKYSIISALIDQLDDGAGAGGGGGGLPILGGSVVR